MVSLCVMGWGLVLLENSSVAAIAAVTAAAVAAAAVAAAAVAAAAVSAAEFLNKKFEGQSLS